MHYITITFKIIALYYSYPVFENVINYIMITYFNVALTDFGCWSTLQRDAKSDNRAKQEFWWETKLQILSFLLLKVQKTLLLSSLLL